MADLGNLPQAYSNNRHGRSLVVPQKPPSHVQTAPTRRNNHRNTFQNRGTGIVAACFGATSGEVVTLLERGQMVAATMAVGGVARFYNLDDGTYIAASAARETSWRIVVTDGVAVVTELTESGGGSFEPNFAYVS